MATNHVGGGAPLRGGRKKLWHENVNLTLPRGAKTRMDAALIEGEDRLDLIRAAIETELRRREVFGASANNKKIDYTPTWAWNSYGIVRSGAAIEWRLPMPIEATADAKLISLALNTAACQPTSTSPTRAKLGSKPKKKRWSPRTDDPRYNTWIKTKGDGRVAAWNDYETFLHDIGERPNGLIFLRRDATALHGPENSYWGAVSERNYLSGRCSKVLYDGKEWSIPELAAKYNIKGKTLRVRLRKMPIHEALHQEVRWGPGHPKYK